MHKASLVNSLGPDFRLMGHEIHPGQVHQAGRLGLRSAHRLWQEPDHAAGIADPARMGYKVAAIRHPMPYGNLVRQEVQRFADYGDLDEHETTIEEREEYEPHIDNGVIVYAGVDYEKIVRAAEKEVDIVLWDGGNNDFSFYVSDLSDRGRRPASARA